MYIYSNNLCRMATPFSAEPKLINEIFGRDLTYIIPEYQRPYSWQCVGKSDKNNQVNVMWNDLYNHFTRDNSSQTSDYFFGSIVLIDKKNQTFEVIDGQQRLTTTILLFVAIKSFLSEVSPSVKEGEVKGFIDETIKFIEDVIYNKKLFGAALTEKKLKIDRSSGFEYDKVLQEVVDGKNEPSKEVVEQATNADKIIISRFFENRNYFKDRIVEFFSNKGEFGTTEARKLNDFIEFLKNKVSVVRILAGDFNIAYHVFEILNNRGLPLSNKDLFRNFIIKEFDQLKRSNLQKYQSLDVNSKWTELESNYEITDDFISRWVESFTANQQRSSAFNDLKEIYLNNFNDTLSKSKIEVFYEVIKQDLGYYTSIVNRTVANPTLKAKLNFILNAPNLRYGVNFLMTLARRFKGLEADLATILDLIVQYERYLTDALLATRFNYGAVYRSIAQINANKIPEAIKILEEGYSVDLIKKWIDQPIYENEIGKLFVSKYIWINESKTADDVVNQSLFYDVATLEHIIPQNPEAGSNWMTDFTDVYRKENTYKLGNMTLLTTKLNSGAKNYSFDVKKQQYQKTKLPITVEIASLVTINETYITDRNQKIIKVILDDLGIS